jgi:hypothetical protein
VYALFAYLDAVKGRKGRDSTARGSVPGAPSSVSGERLCVTQRDDSQPTLEELDLPPPSAKGVGSAQLLDEDSASDVEMDDGFAHPRSPGSRVKDPDVISSLPMLVTRQDFLKVT